MTQQFNRGQLLDKAFKGEIKAGDKFRRIPSGDVVTFEGRRFKWNDNSTMEMNVFNKLELFEKHEEKHTIVLTQKEVNSIRTLIGDDTIYGLKRKKEQYSHPFEVIEDGEEYNQMFEKLEKLVK
ncbi:hypothetical protein HQK17_28160 [Bacillus cereus]|uniref:hypothetical protein n=1 Tax=Bacillus cereus TaxID=1396 RepID=UPI00156A7BB4|nr:hypothetical protein [Bacillus cereus]NRQ71997.1 hypothetical protein [Bacillus cereus]